MHSHVLKRLSHIFVFLLFASLSVTLIAQDAPKPAKASDFDSPSRWDIFAGYSYLAPKGTVEVPVGGGTTLPESYKAMDKGALVSAAVFFNKHVGAQVESGFHDLFTNGSSSNG